MIGAILVVCVQILSTYTGHGVDYIGSYIMEEESLYFSERYAKDPLTPLPKTAFFTGVIGKQSLPENVRLLLESPPTRVVGTVQIFEDIPETPFAVYLQMQPLGDGKVLYLFETLRDEDREEVPRLSEEYFEKKIRGLIAVGLSVPLTALLVIVGLVWLIINPLHRLTRWSTAQGNPGANPGLRPNFSYRELNILASSLADSVQRVKAASLREERLLRYSSHELRTPLAIAKANLQLLALNGELSPPLQRLQRSVQNMQNITETLLWMSKEHSAAPAIETVDIRLMLGELMEDHEYLAGSRNLKLMITAQETLYLLPAQACRIIFGNLLRNVLQYADEGYIEIVCTPQQLSVINRVGVLRSGDDSADFGYGLGLELVQQLCERLGWQVHLHEEEHCFTAVIIFAPY